MCDLSVFLVVFVITDVLVKCILLSSFNYGVRKIGAVWEESTWRVGLSFTAFLLGLIPQPPITDASVMAEC